MGAAEQFLVWTWSGQRYGLPLLKINRVLQMVEVCALTEAPPGVIGLVNVQGEIIPLYSLGPESKRAVQVDQFLILARRADGQIALVAERLLGLTHKLSDDVIESEKIMVGLNGIEAVLKLAEGLVLVPDLEKLPPTPEVGGKTMGNGNG